MSRLRAPSSYLRNCFWLWLPPLAISFALWEHLGPAYQPEIFGRGIPPWLGWTENILRIIVIALSAVMPFELVRPRQRFGFGLYLIGLGTYAASQLSVAMSPTSDWSTSFVGFTAPAYTTIFWMVGIGFIGDGLYLSWVPWRRWIYFLLVSLFVAAHTRHAGLVYLQNF